MSLSLHFPSSSLSFPFLLLRYLWFIPILSSLQPNCVPPCFTLSWLFFPFATPIYFLPFIPPKLSTVDLVSDSIPYCSVVFVSFSVIYCPCFHSLFPPFSLLALYFVSSPSHSYLWLLNLFTFYLYLPCLPPSLTSLPLVALHLSYVSVVQVCLSGLPVTCLSSVSFVAFPPLA